MQNNLSEKNYSIWSSAYWRDASANFSKIKLLAFAAIIIALRVAVKFFRIPLAAGLSVTFDCYVNALGSAVYGPLVGLAVGAVSDTIGCIVAPTGPYFFPFIFVEMSSAFLFGLFFWKRNLSVSRVLTAKFTVNLVCNIILTSLLMKWSYYLFYGIEKAEGYAVINLTRIVKNLVLFPAESVLICLFIGALTPPLASLGLLKKQDLKTCFTKKDILLTVLLTVLSIALVLFYIFFLSDFIKTHNLKFW